MKIMYLGNLKALILLLFLFLVEKWLLKPMLTKTKPFSKFASHFDKPKARD